MDERSKNMLNISEKKIKQLLEQKLHQIMDGDDEKNGTEVIKKDDKTYIHVHHDNSIILMLYLYLFHYEKDYTMRDNVNMEGIFESITKIRRKNKHFYDQLDLEYEES